MQTSIFDNQINALQNEILDLIEGHFLRRGMRFDRVAYLDQAQCCFGQIVVDAFFYGAEVFPSEPSTGRHTNDLDVIGLRDTGSSSGTGSEPSRCAQAAQ